MLLRHYSYVIEFLCSYLPIVCSVFYVMSCMFRIAKGKEREGGRGEGGREGGRKGGREESEVEGRVAEKIGAGFTHMCWMLAFDTVDRLASVASKTFLHNIVERPCMYCIHVPVAICSS